MASREIAVLPSNELATGSRLTSSEGPWPCEFCRKVVQTKNGMIKHMRRFHPEERMKSLKFSCSEGCGVAFSSIGLLREHYIGRHGLEDNVLNAEFASLEEFYRWKESQEQETLTKFVVKDRRSAGQKGRTRVIYCCHRSGELSVPTGKRRSTRSRTGLREGVVVCTAAMRAYLLPCGKVELTYFPEHWGHSGDIRLFLSKEQRQEIGRKLASGCGPNDILREYSESDNPRLRAVDRQAIYRVARDFGIPWVWRKQGQQSTSEQQDAYLHTNANQNENSSAEEEEEEIVEDEEDNEENPDAVTHGQFNDDGSGDRCRQRRLRALNCLSRLTSMLTAADDGACGGELTDDDVATLEAVEDRLQQRAHLKQLEASASQQMPPTCVLYLNPHEQPQQNIELSVMGTEPKDLNVSIINCVLQRQTGHAHRPVVLCDNEAGDQRWTSDFAGG